MSRLIILDSGPLGMVTNPKTELNCPPSYIISMRRELIWFTKMEVRSRSLVNKSNTIEAESANQRISPS